MKWNSRSGNWYFLLSYLVFAVMISLLFYLLAPVLGITGNRLLQKETWVLFAILIISSGVFLYFMFRIFISRITADSIHTQQTIHRYEALSRATNDAIWDYDMQTEKVYYNDRVMEIFGYTPYELSDNTNWWENNIHPEDKLRVVDRMNAVLESSKNSWEDEYRFRCKNGDYKIVYDRSFIARDQQGKPLRLIGAMKDVTKLRMLEKNMLTQQLQSKNEMGKTIILSHEIERKRIKDILQEDINQMLASIKFLMIEVNNQHPSPAISNSLRHLEEAMKKIMGVSKKLSSSTFEFFGLVEGIHELIVDFSLLSPVVIELEAGTFEESKINKETGLLLFRILEDKLTRITRNIKTDKINITLSNNQMITTMNVSFQSMDTEVENQLNQATMIGIKSMLEMFGGTIEMKKLPGNMYITEVMI